MLWSKAQIMMGVIHLIDQVVFKKKKKKCLLCVHVSYSVVLISCIPAANQQVFIEKFIAALKHSSPGLTLDSHL